MIDAVVIIFIILGVLLSLVLLIELIGGIYKRVKMKQQEKEWEKESIKNTFDEIRHRLDYHGEKISQIEWKVMEMEEKLNEKKSNRTKRNK